MSAMLQRVRSFIPNGKVVLSVWCRNPSSADRRAQERKVFLADLDVFGKLAKEFADSLDKDMIFSTAADPYLEYSNAIERHVDGLLRLNVDNITPDYEPRSTFLGFRGDGEIEYARPSLYFNVKPASGVGKYDLWVAKMPLPYVTALITMSPMEVADILQLDPNWYKERKDSRTLTTTGGLMPSVFRVWKQEDLKLIPEMPFIIKEDSLGDTSFPLITRPVSVRGSAPEDKAGSFYPLARNVPYYKDAKGETVTMSGGALQRVARAGDGDETKTGRVLIGGKLEGGDSVKDILERADAYRPGAYNTPPPRSLIDLVYRFFFG